MHDENSIRLSGTFSITDSSGRIWSIDAIRIFDEGYGLLDVYVDFAESMDDEPLYDDPRVIGQILSKLRSIGYAGPDFGVGAADMQDDKLIVLEAPEAFGDFAASLGWKNLAEEYAPDDELPAATGNSEAAQSSADQVFDVLMRKLRGLK
jgi:hypothetical protein